MFEWADLLSANLGECWRTLRLGLSAWDKRCLKQQANHLKMDAGVPGYRVILVKADRDPLEAKHYAIEGHGLMN